MKMRGLILVLFLSATTVLPGHAQTSIQAENKAYIDSIDQYAKVHLCNDILTYPDNYNKKELNEDKSIIFFLNNLFKADFTDSRLNRELKKVKGTGKNTKRTENGLIKIVSLILNGHYIRADVKMEYIDGYIFSKSCVIMTLTNDKCGAMKFGIFDFKLFKEHLGQELGFKISFRYNSFEAKKLILENLRLSAVAHPEYKFNLPATGNLDWDEKVYLKQYDVDSSCCYSDKKGNADFVSLIRDGKIEVIKSMLYSPNYFYSIHAMEALIYLNDIKKNIIDDSLQRRIAAIRQGDFPVVIQKSGDLFITVGGYKGIKNTEQEVIVKYRNSLELGKNKP